MTRKLTPTLRAYRIIQDAVETGIAFGWNRAHKHTDNPAPESVKDHLLDEIMLALDGVVDFGE